MATRSVRKTATAIQKDGARMIRVLRRDAEALMARGRAEVMKDVRAIRTGADRAVRELERKVVRQLHAVSQDQLKRLERRVVKLERAVAELMTRARGAPEKAA